ncbi:MAG: hypothetical protein ACXWX6_11275 [Actinomycetota bacterium]
MSTQPQRDQITEERSTADLAGVGEAPAGSAFPASTVTGEMAEAPPERSADDEESRPLLGEDELSGYRTRWESVQVRFVDDPRGTVKEADTLVADLMQRLAQTFADERASLESQWEQGTDASTEDLRVAMQRYRSFFTRLLAA